MNIRFLFEFLESQKSELTSLSTYTGDEYNDGRKDGYLQAIDDFEDYLKQAIELTKDDTT